MSVPFLGGHLDKIKARLTTVPSYGGILAICTPKIAAATAVAAKQRWSA